MGRVEIESEEEGGLNDESGDGTIIVEDKGEISKEQGRVYYIFI